MNRSRSGESTVAGETFRTPLYSTARISAMDRVEPTCELPAACIICKARWRIFRASSRVACASMVLAGITGLIQARAGRAVGGQFRRQITLVHQSPHRVKENLGVAPHRALTNIHQLHPDLVRLHQLFNPPSPHPT